jgi:tRNA (cytidine/uridine-2'-O-)-methyltransferase
LIQPFGFSTSDKNLRRAGLDYWPFLDLEIHDTLDELLQLFPGKFAFLSKKAQKPFFEIPDSCELLIFGKETTGLPSELHEKYTEDFYQIPMYHPGVRSLNLANAVSAVIYDRIRRLHHSD